MRVLLAEDEEDLNFIITQKLRSEGYSVDSCYDGEEALDALAVVDYDAIILDIMMPKIDGLEVLRSFRQTGKTITVADLTMDCAAHTVTRAGQEISLSAKEYALLEYLLQNKGIVLSREKIEDHIWDFDYEGGTNVVDVYIRYLRKKLDDDYNNKLIHTVRGRGYVIREEI